MLVPVVSSLASQYPDLRITVLSRGFARPLFEGLAPHVGFMEADLKNDYHGVHGLNALYRRLKAKQFTAVADMHGVLRSWYLRQRFRLDRFRVASIDKHRSGKRQLAAKSGKVLVQQPTSFQNYADVLAQLGYPVNLTFHSIFGPAGGDLRLLPPAVGMKAADGQWVGIAPFAAHQGKILPVEKMEEVIVRLTERHPTLRLFLFGGGDREREQIAQWCARYPQCVNVAAHTAGLMQELIIMSHLDVMVSMDSANMHFASLTGTPVVSVWGATHPYAGFLGWGQRADDVVQADLPCRPCSIYGNRPCHRGDYACLMQIQPDDIIYKVEKRLSTPYQSSTKNE